MSNDSRDSMLAELARLRALARDLERRLAQSPAQERTAQPPVGQEGYYRRLLETLHFVPWEGPIPEGDAPGPYQFRYVGPQAEALLGYPLADWYAPGFWESHLHPEDRDAAVALCLEQSRQGRDHEFEYRMVAADGRSVWIFDAVRVVEDDRQGRSLRGLLLDITERKQTEESLRQTKEWLTLALEAGSLLCYQVDLQTKQAVTSGDVAAFVGAPPGTVLRPHLDDILAPVHPADRPAAAAALEKVLAGEEPQGLEFRGAWSAPDGGAAWFHTRTHLHRDAAGRPRWLVGVTCDITARRRDEERRRLIEVQIHQAQHLESLGVLAGGIAHEFNNLLTTIQGYTDLARAETPPGTAHNHLGEVLASARRASELTQQILAYAGKSRFVLQPTSLSDLVTQMGPLFAAAVPRKSRLLIDAGDPPPIEADPAQLRQVILNLVSNAAEALGGEEGTITLRTAAVTLDDPPGRFAMLEVSDTGCGMDEATRARIFEPFFSTKFAGRGLGLAAVLGIVRGHGGLLRVQSAPGEGSTFRMYLPSRSRAAAEAPARARGKVLVVDDEDSVRKLVAMVLQQAGYEVVSAPDGIEGLRRFLEGPGGFAACVIDLTMPRMDGLDLLGQIRKARPDARVVLMTGFSAPEAGRRAGSPSADRLLQKPFTAKTLLEAVRAALGGGAAL